MFFISNTTSVLMVILILVLAYAFICYMKYLDGYLNGKRHKLAEYVIYRLYVMRSLGHATVDEITKVYETYRCFSKEKLDEFNRLLTSTADEIYQEYMEGYLSVYNDKYIPHVFNLVLIKALKEDNKRVEYTISLIEEIYELSTVLISGKTGDLDHNDMQFMNKYINQFKESIL